MSRASHYDHNYPKIIEYLNDRNYEYTESRQGFIKIDGPKRNVKLWPAQMSYIVLDSNDSRIHQLDCWFSATQMDWLLKGEWN